MPAYGTRPAELPPAELALIGGHVHTLDPAKPQATAVAIAGGRILWVGDDSEVRSLVKGDTRVIELHGRSVVPGLADSHMHLQSLGARHAGIDLVGTKSLADVKARVAAAAKTAAPGAWITGRGWDQNDWVAPGKKSRFPNARDLDAVSGDHPVLLERIDGHASWANTRAMQLAEIGPKTLPPRGGDIRREGGKPSGIFIDLAMDLIGAKVPPPSAKEVRAAYLSAQDECLRAGLTQVHDMGVGASELAVLKELDASGALKLRVYAFLAGSTEDLAGLMGAGPFHGKNLTVRGVKFYMDGALGSRGAALLEPYTDDPRNSGLLLTDLGLLEARVRSAHGRGYQVATHAIGDRANRLVLEVYGRVFGTRTATATAGAPGARPRIEHAQIVAPEDIARFGREGVIASMQPTHATSDMPWAEARLGRDRLRGAYAWHSMLTASATVAAGSDAPIEDISPIAGLYAAITRQDAAGQPPGGWLPAERLTPAQALRAFTEGAAYASFREDEAGMIRQNFAADLTVLDRDPLAVAPAELLKARIEATIVGGHIGYEAPASSAPAATPPAPAAPEVPAPDAGPSGDAGGS